MRKSKFEAINTFESDLNNSQLMLIEDNKNNDDNNNADDFRIDNMIFSPKKINLKSRGKTLSSIKKIARISSLAPITEEKVVIETSKSLKNGVKINEILKSKTYESMNPVDKNEENVIKKDITRNPTKKTTQKPKITQRKGLKLFRVFAAEM